MSKSNHRRVRIESQIGRLEQRHAQLKAACDQLEYHARLTDTEEMELQRLKKEKLRTKDELEELRAVS